MITKVINVNLHQPIYEKLTAKQGDIASRYLLFHLLDGDKPFDLTGKSVRVYARKPDKTEIFNDLIINDKGKGYCTLELTSQCLASAGIVKMELYISQSSKVLTSIPFDLEVISCINTANSVVSTNEFSALEAALGSLQNFDNFKNEIVEARNGYETIGKRLDNFDSQLEQKPNEGIEKWIKQTNDVKSIYFAGDSTSDDTIPYYDNSPTKCLYDRLQKVGVGEGFPLEGVKICNGHATSGCTSKDYLNGTAPATDRNLNKLLNALRSDDRKYKLVILSLGLNNNGDDTFQSKYKNITQIINKILEIENTFILLRMPNSIADTDDLTHSNLMRDLYIALDNDKHPRTSMLHTQKLLWGEQAGFIPTRGYYTNANYPQWCVIVEGGKAWKPTTYGTSGSVKPNFAQGNKGDTLADGTVVWTCLGKGTDLFLNPYHPSQKGFEKLADLLIEVLTDKSKIDDKFKNDIYENYVDTNPLFDVYRGAFIISGEYEGIINKIEKGDIIQVGNNYSELGKIKGIYNPNLHDISNNDIAYGQYVYINGYTWRCVYYGTADFANFPSLDDTLNINKTVFQNGTATFALECKGKMIEIDADGVTTGNSIIGAYRKRLRLIKRKSSETVLGCVLRPTTDINNPWKLFEDDAHESEGITSITHNSDGTIQLNFDKTYKKIKSFNAFADEMMKIYGLEVGASVGLSSAKLFLISNLVFGFTINFSIANGISCSSSFVERCEWVQGVGAKVKFKNVPKQTPNTAQVSTTNTLNLNTTCSITDNREIIMKFYKPDGTLITDISGNWNTMVDVNYRGLVNFNALTVYDENILSSMALMFTANMKN